MKYIKDSWHYKSTEEKKKAIVKTGLYECHADYFIAFKAVRPKRVSMFNCHFVYNRGITYETWADTSREEDSFGFGCGTYKYAQMYSENVASQIIKVIVYYEDVARVIHKGHKIRAFKIKPVL